MITFQITANGTLVSTKVYKTYTDKTMTAVYNKVASVQRKHSRLTVIQLIENGRVIDTFGGTADMYQKGSK